MLDQPPAPAALTLRGLVKRYDGRAVVDGLDLDAPAGRITAVLGPNGAGKTTTIECCEGLRIPDAGTVRVLGLDPMADAAALRPRVGVMLQDAGLPTGAPALAVLRHVAAMYADPRPVDELVERLGIGRFARTTVRRLSGGQRQRLALATAVVGRPELVFLDEPSAGMDPQARHAVWELVAELRADGVAVVLTTHLMDEAEALADRVAVVDHGRVIAAGTVDELLRGDGAAGAGDVDAPGTAADGLHFHAAPGLEVTELTTVLSGPGGPDPGPGGSDPGPGGPTGRPLVRETAPGRYTVEGPASPELIATLAGWCATRGVLLTRMETGRRTLEDVFLDLTGRRLR